MAGVSVDKPELRFNRQWFYLENGRYYHTYKRGKYLLPCDEEEKERLDIFHKFFSVARKGRLYNVPLDDVEDPKILDIGSGTGIWAIDMCDKFCDGTVLGLDIAGIQPEYIPPQSAFWRMDVEDPWQGVELDAFDMAHIRTMMGSISDWPKLYRQAYRCLKPYRGYLEQVEIDFTPYCDDDTLPKENSTLHQCINNWMDCMEEHGQPMRFDSEKVQRMMSDAGFEEIQEEVIKIPYNGWPSDPELREMGMWFNLGVSHGLEAFTLAPLHRLRGWSKDEVLRMNESVKEEMCSRHKHAYCHLYIWTARKPF